MELRQAFDISRGDVAAFVGAGGKTSLLVGLGYELAENGWRVLATSTATIPAEQLNLFPHAMPYDSGAQAISEALSRHQFVFLYDNHSRRNGSVSGPKKEWTRELLDSVDSDVLLVEADQSNGLPFKAPRKHEPLIPPETTLVVPVASLAALGKPLDENHIYNPRAMSKRYGFVENSAVKAPWLAQVLRDESMGLKDVPRQARVAAYLNQTPESEFLRGRARTIARLTLLNPRVQAVALGSVRAAEPVYEIQRPVGAIVLAATDFAGDRPPEMLRTLNGRPCPLAQVTERLIRARVNPIRVAACSWAKEVRQAVKPLGVKVAASRAGKRSSAARNGHDSPASGELLHAHGESLFALKAGLRSMSENIAAVLLVQGDQRQLQAKVIHEMLSAYARGAGDLLVPRFQSSLGQPVLIGRRYWNDILALPRKGSLGDVFARYADNLACVDVSTDTILRADSPSMPKQSAAPDERENTRLLSHRHAV